MIEVQNSAIVAGAYWLGECQFTLRCMPPQVASLVQFSNLDRCSCRYQVAWRLVHAGSIAATGDSSGLPAFAVRRRKLAPRPQRVRSICVWRLFAMRCSSVKVFGRTHKHNWAQIVLFCLFCCVVVRLVLRAIAGNFRSYTHSLLNCGDFTKQDCSLCQRDS